MGIDLPVDGDLIVQIVIDSLDLPKSKQFPPPKAQVDHPHWPRSGLVVMEMGMGRLGTYLEEFIADD